MPTYQVTDPQTGTQLQLDGDSPPTEAELTQIFAQSKGTAPAPAPAPAPVPALTQNHITGIGDVRTSHTPSAPYVIPSHGNSSTPAAPVLPPVKRAANTRTGGYAPAPDSGLPPSLGQMQFDAAQKAVTQTVPARIWDLAKGAAWDFPYKAGEVIRDTATGFGTTIGENLFPPDGDMANTQEKGIDLTKKALSKGVEEAKGLIPFRSTLEKTVLKGALKGFSLAAKDAGTSADLDAHQGKIHPLYDLAQEAIADPLGTGAQAAMFLGAAAHMIDSAAPEVAGKALRGFRPIPREDAAAPMPPPIQATPPAEPTVSDTAPPAIDTGTTPVRAVRDSSGKVQLIPTGPDIPPDAPSATPAEPHVNRATSPVETPVPAPPSDSITGPKTPVESPSKSMNARVTGTNIKPMREGEFPPDVLEAHRKYVESESWYQGPGDIATRQQQSLMTRRYNILTKKLRENGMDEMSALARLTDIQTLDRMKGRVETPAATPTETPVSALAPVTPLTRNFTAGTKSGSITFDSELQKDLYDTGARLRKLQKDAGTRGVAFNPVDAAALKSKIASIQQRTNMSHAEVATLARDVHDDVRMQMKGVGDGEARTVTDNVIKRSLGNRTPAPAAPVETPKPVPALAQTPEEAPPEALAKSSNPTIRKKATKIADDLIADSEKEMRRMEGGQLNSAVNLPEYLYHNARWLAGHIIRGTTKLADAPAFLRERLGDAADKVMPHVKDVVDKAKEIVAGMADRVSHQDDLGFYLKSERVIEQKMGGKASAESVASMLKGAGVSPEEMKWTGLDKFLEERKGQTVTKSDLYAHLNENAPELSEARKGYDPQKQKLQDRANELIKEAYETPGVTSERIREIQKEIDKLSDQQLAHPVKPSRYQDYKLPGGENYREHILTLPKKADPFHAKALKDYADAMEELDAAGLPRNATRFQIRQALGEEAENRIHEARMTSPDNVHLSGNENYTHAHWPDETNPVGHYRTTDRVGPNGEKILHLEEVQSDWGQAARKHGIKPTDADLEAARQDLREKDLKWRRLKSGGTASSAELDASHEAAGNAARRVNALEDASVSGPPDAPFIGSTSAWSGLILRRALRNAAENGYDKISWTPGEDQAEHYPEDNGGPKDQARKKGMQGFYDKIVPEYLNSYGKKFGVSAGTTEIDTGDGIGHSKYTVEWGPGDRHANSWHNRAIAEQIAERTGGKVVGVGKTGKTVQSFDITPAMRDDILEKGQSLFGGSTPEGGSIPGSPDLRVRALKVADDLITGAEKEMQRITKNQTLNSGADLLDYAAQVAKFLAGHVIKGTVGLTDAAAFLKERLGERFKDIESRVPDIISQARTIVATHAGAMDFAGMREDKTGQSAADIVRAFQADDPSISRNKGPRLKDSEVRQLAEDLDLTPKQLLENPAIRGKDAVEAAKLRGYAQGAVEWVKEAQEKHFKERTPETQAELHAATEMARALVEAASGRATEAGRTLRQYRMTVEAINYRSAKEEAAAEMFPGGKHDTSEEAQIAKPKPSRASAGTGRETPVPKEKTPRSPSAQGTPTTRRPPKPSFGSILRQKIETDPGIVKAREAFFASLRRTRADIPFAPGIHAIPELVNLAKEYIRVGVESYSEWHGDVANRMTPEEYRKHTEENWRQSWAAAGGKAPGEAPVPKSLEKGTKPPSQTQMDFGEEADFSKASTLYLPEEARSSLQSLRDIQTKSGKPPAFDAVTKSKLTRIGGYLYETGKAEGMRNFGNWADYMQKLLSKNIRGIAEANPTADATHKFESVTALASGERSIPTSVLEEVWRNLPRDAEARVRQAATIRQQAVNAMNAAMGKGNADSLLRRLDRIKEFDDKGVPNPDYHRQIMHLVKESRKSGIIETALQLSKAGLISSSRVLLKINASHAAYLTTEEIAKIPAAFLDAARVGINTARGVESSRTIALPRMTDIRRAMRIAKEARSEAKIIALKGEQGLRDAGIPDRFQGKGNTDILHTEHYSGDSAMSKTVDWLINQTYRLHGADYHIMKTFAYEKALAENARVEAINEARTQGLPSSYVEPRVKELLTNPPEHITAQALYDMEVATFINQNKMSNLLTDAKFKYGLGMRVGADIAAPFPRIPTNVVARTMEYHPAGTALGFVEHLIQNLETHAPYGEWKPEQVRALTRIFGRSSVGTGAMALGAFLAANNLLIPSDIRTGEKGSLRLYNPKNGKWDRKAQIGGIGGPLFAMLMSGANYYDLATADSPTKAEDWWSATASPLAELPLVSGAELVSSLKEGKGVEGIVAGQASSRLIPSLLSDTAKTFDKYERERSLSGDGPGIKALRAKALAHPESITKEQRDIIKQYDALKANADASAGTRSGFWGGMGGALKDTRDLTGNFLQARIPGLANKLPPKLDRTGEPIPSSYALVDPYAIGKQTPEQESVVLRQEIARKMTDAVKEKNKKSTPGRLNYDIRPEDKIFKSFVASLKGLDVEQLREYARTGVDPRSKIQSVRPTSMTPASIGR